ncbi:hypothetical protein AWH63_10545 [Marinobacter sp. C18]|uniref:hypothetical protein n=1 Tax=Marinobacter sp. C18 TaxID=1772288 RepID=UPI000948AF58|nr:hypothetical protein [Marinobacter sp. C18]OLF81969.1 hypothetical protein AWH63_10545 [Marinobacter sp. C18]
MLGKKAKNSEQTVAEIVANLTDKICELSEKNGELNAVNKSLETQVKTQDRQIQKLESEVRLAQDMQSDLIDAAAKMGINLKPIKNGSPENRYWVERGLELAGNALQPKISQFSLPDFDSAKSAEELQKFLGELPGFGSTDNEKVAKEQYGYTQVNAEQFIIREKH